MTEILITSSVLILALLALRKLFRNTLSRRLQYALWGLVLLRLLAPVSLPAVDFSVLTAARPVEQTVTRTIAARPVYVPVARAPLAEHPAAPDVAPEQAELSEGESVWLVETEDTAVQYKRLSARTVLAGVWAAGSGAAAVFLITVNLRFWLKLRRSRRLWPAEGCPLPVYLVETGLSSPCLFGLFHPAVYLTPAALSTPERTRHVLAHETTHARHLDHLWTLLRGVCLAVYWFDPLVWIASAAARTDCELACDEGALARLSEEERIPYGQTLLSLIPVRRAANPMLAATTMAAGKRQLKDRFTRIAQKQKPRQLAAAAVAAALLAGVVSACTFTGAKTPEVTLPAQEPSRGEAGLQALTGEELRWFNERFFNGAGTKDEYGYNVYSICNQFASPWYPYDDVKDINLYELFYCDGSTEMGAGELQAALGVQDELNLPCPAYKLTREEIDRVLTRYAGLTLEQTNKVGLESFDYAADYDAYYWMHGDTNYCGDLLFLLGTREGDTVKLYQGSGGAWTCVTLEEQEEGGWWFKSNRACEKPVIPTPLPAGEPEAVIPLDSLEPYEAPAVTLETRVDDYAYEGGLADRLVSWDIDGHNILLYRDTGGAVNAAVQANDTRQVFLTDIGEHSSIFFYNDLFGHSGFTVSYDQNRAEDVRYPGVVTDYFYFGEDGALVLLLRAVDGGTPEQTMALDLDGDGTDELVTSEDLFIQRDGRLYRAGLEELIGEACPKLEYWGSRTWDVYSKCLRITGYGGTADGEWRDIERYLYFDGEQLLLYKLEKPYHDHVVDGAGKYVPGAVVDAAKDYVEQEIIVARPDGTWRHKGYEDEGWPQETYDDWRIENIGAPYTTAVGDITVECWYFNYELHTTTPEQVLLAGGKYLTEDGWVSPGYPNCDWLFFRVEGEERTLLWRGMANDITPGSELFQEHLNWILEQNGLSA